MDKLVGLFSNRSRNFFLYTVSTAIILGILLVLFAILYKPIIFRGETIIGVKEDSVPSSNKCNGIMIKSHSSTNKYDSRLKALNESLRNNGCSIIGTFLLSPGSAKKYKSSTVVFFHESDLGNAQKIRDYSSKKIKQNIFTKYEANLGYKVPKKYLEIYVTQ